MSDSRKPKMEGPDKSLSSPISYQSWLQSHSKPKSKSMIYKALRQNDFYHNPGPLFQLISKANESTVFLEGQKARALIDTCSQLSSISVAWAKKFKLNPQQLHSVLQIEGSGDLKYLIWVIRRLTSRCLKLVLLVLMSFY